MESGMMIDNDVLGVHNFDLDALRCAIDKIDEEILKLINKRLNIAVEIGKLKTEKKEPIVDHVREKNIIERLSALNHGPLQQEALQEIFTLLIILSRKIQKNED
jgi:monofunctional chorismate mutase